MDEGLRALPGCAVVSGSERVLGNLLRFERIYTFRDDAPGAAAPGAPPAERKRKQWLLYVDRWLLCLTWQGASAPAYEHWFAMANQSFLTFEIPQALWFFTDRELLATLPRPEPVGRRGRGDGGEKYAPPALSREPARCRRRGGAPGRARRRRSRRRRRGGSTRCSTASTPSCSSSVTSPSWTWRSTAEVVVAYVFRKADGLDAAYLVLILGIGLTVFGLALVAEPYLRAALERPRRAALRRPDGPLRRLRGASSGSPGCWWGPSPSAC